jgi:agmatine deiminase
MKKHEVYISTHLPHAVNNNTKYGEEAYNALKSINEIEIKEIENSSKNVWCRDYMPVKSARGKYIRFTYQPAYMRGMKKYENNFPDVEMILQKFGLEATPSDIVLDGGAIEIFGNKGIVSDRVFRDNKNKTATEIYNELKKVLGLDQLIVIPQYPYDFTGHVDGLVRFIDENRVVVNDLNKELKQSEADENQYRKKLIENWVYAFQSALISAGMEINELPDSLPENGSPNSGEGIYINFLLLDDLIIMPAYGDKKEKEVMKTDKEVMKTDDAAMEKLAGLYDVRKVIKVNAKKLSQMGGMINCVTWTK